MPYTYRVKLIGLPGRIGPVTYTCTVQARNGTAAVAIAEHRQRVTELDYDAANALRI